MGFRNIPYIILSTIPPTNLKMITTLEQKKCAVITVTRELKQTRRRRKRERHLKMWLSVSAIIFQLFKLIMLVKWVLTILELNWNKRLGHEKTKLNICHHTLTSSTHLQNWSFHVVERTRTSTKCQKMKNARAKRAKILFFTVKYANLWGFCCRRRRGCLKPLLHVETFSWNLCATALRNMFQQALHRVTWSVSWNFLLRDKFHQK